MTPSTATTSPVRARASIVNRVRSTSWAPALIASITLLVIGGILSPGYATWANINQIVASAAILSIAASAQTLVMVSGDYGIDLSVGQVMSLTAVVAFMLLSPGTSALPLAIGAVLLVGAAFGLINGTLVTVVRLPALVVTLATLVIAQGVIFALTSTGTPRGSVPPLLASLTTHSLGGVKYVTFVAAILIIALAVFIRRSRYGQLLFLVGSSRNASVLTGIPTRRVVITTFVMAGMASGIGGILLLSYAGTANLDLGSDYLLLSIAAAVIGGTSLAGGEGSIIGAATGALAFQVISSFMQTLGAPDAVRQICIGVMVLLLLTFNARTPKLRQ